MIDFECPHCEAPITKNSGDREAATCDACGNDYMRVQFGWCWHNIKLPHECTMKTYGNAVLCSMCGTSNKASTEARIALLGGEGPLASVLEKTIEED